MQNYWLNFYIQDFLTSSFQLIIWLIRCVPNSNPPTCFVCAVNLLHVRSIAHCLPQCFFSLLHCNELPTPPSASISGLHVIGSLLATVIRIVWFFLFFPVLLVSFLIFCFFLVVVSFFILPFYFPIHFHSCFCL